jgi:hypothetical protein
MFEITGLVTCRSCGIMYNAKAVNFPSQRELYALPWEEREEKTVYSRDSMEGVPCAKCRVCGGIIAADGSLE